MLFYNRNMPLTSVAEPTAYLLICKFFCSLCGCYLNIDLRIFNQPIIYFMIDSMAFWYFMSNALNEIHVKGRVLNTKLINLECAQDIVLYHAIWNSRLFWTFSNTGQYFFWKCQGSKRCILSVQQNCFEYWSFYICYINLMCLKTDDLQILINLCYQYSRKWRFSFGINKTHCMISNKNPFIKYPSWNLGGQNENAETLEILGTMFTSNISCDAHIDKRVNASRRAMYALASVGCSYPGLATEVKVHLWKTIGLPSLLYNLEIFKLKPGQQKFIESVQSSIIKRIVGFPKRSHHTALLQAVNIDDVISSVTRNTLSLWWRLFQVDNPARKLQIKLMKEFYNGNGLIPGTILQRVVSAGFSPIKSVFTKQLNVNPEVNSPRDGVVDSL